MNDRRLSDTQIAAALRARLPAQAQAGLPGRVMDAVECTSQRRSLPSFLGAISDADSVAARRSLLIAAALLLGLALASAAAVGAWRLLQRDTVPKLDLTPPGDLPAFVLSTYDRMPQMPPVAITTLTDGSVKGRMYVDRSGAVRFEHYATQDAPTPDTYKILKGTTMGQLAIVGSTKEWVQQDGAIANETSQPKRKAAPFLTPRLEGSSTRNAVSGSGSSVIAIPMRIRSSVTVYLACLSAQRSRSCYFAFVAGRAIICLIGRRTALAPCCGRVVSLKRMIFFYLESLGI